MRAFYNDNEQYVCEWTKNLIANGLISPGDVSNESIKALLPWDLMFYDRAHFFSGIAGWDHALNLAGFPKDLKVWSGSCPCQPFSVAGKRKGVDDERHLWPVFRELIRECKPPIVFGEQVASKDGRVWLAGVRTDFKAMGYDFWAVDTCAAGVGAPHIRQRLYWVAYAKCWTTERYRYNLANSADKDQTGKEKQERLRDDVRDGSNFGGLAYSERDPRRAGRLTVESGESDGTESTGPSIESGRLRDISGMGNTALSREWTFDGESGPDDGQEESNRRSSISSGLADANGGIVGNGGLQPGREYGQQQKDRRANGLVHATGEQEGLPGQPRQPRGAGIVGLGDSHHQRSQGRLVGGDSTDQRSSRPAGMGFWGDYDIIPCADGKARRVESGVFPLAHGVSARVGKLRAYGNAIVPQVAAEFVSTFMDVVGIEPIR